MKEIKVNELTDNLFETISKEWMVVTAGTKDKGEVGIISPPPVPKTNSTP